MVTSSVEFIFVNICWIWCQQCEQTSWEWAKNTCVEHPTGKQVNTIKWRAILARLSCSQETCGARNFFYNVNKMIAFWFYFRGVSGIGAALVLPHVQLWFKETQHTKPILVFSSSHTLFLPSLTLSFHFPCPTRHDPMCWLQGGVVKVWASCAEWRWCTDGDVLPLQPRRCRETEEKGKGEEELEEGAAKEK